MAANLSKARVSELIRTRFEDIDTSTISEIYDLSDFLEVAPATKIITQGENTKEVYFLLSGRMAVYLKDEAGEEKKINEIPCGELFGEMSVFIDEKRSTSVVSIRQSLLLKIDGKAFIDFLDNNPKFYKYISGTVIRRLAHTNQGKSGKKVSKNISLIPLAGDYDALGFAKKLEDELKAFGKVLIIDKALFSKQNSQSDFSTYLNRIEFEFDYIIFIAPFEEKQVASAMMVHSDNIYWIGDQQRCQGVKPEYLTTKNEKLTFHNVSSYLILDSLEYNVIEGSHRCLKHLEVETILHLHRAKDYGRIARFIAGRSNKLVLSGGGARGCAHLGVYKALLELEIPIDIVGGTSIGSIMSALVACGWPFDEILEKAYHAFITAKPLKDYQIPIVSLLKGKRLDKTLKASFGDLRIEDLPIPYVAIAANLSKLSTEVINRGLLYKAARASISIPSVLPPTVRNNSLLLDGGIVDNMPYDPVQEICDGPIIGVDLSTIKKRDLGYDKIPSNLELTKSKFTRGRKYKVPNIYQIIMGTMTLASDEKKRANIPKFDVYIRPNVGKYGFLDFKKFNELVEEGYRSSIDVLREWKENNG